MTPDSPELDHRSNEVILEKPAPYVGRIVVDRDHTRNAQDTRLIRDIDSAYEQASRDSEIKVLILSTKGEHFSSGHDLKESNIYSEEIKKSATSWWVDSSKKGIEPQMARETDLYIEACERWRNFPKPTIAQVQGVCAAGGLMLAWPCDLIVASEDAVFYDNTVELGVNGCEYFVHAYELGIRKAKEMLFTGRSLTAADALEHGMINKVVDRTQLEQETLELASEIAKRPSFALKLTKMSINAVQDNQGRRSVIDTSFALHQLAHSHNMLVHNHLIDPSGLGHALKNIDLSNLSGNTNE